MRNAFAISLIAVVVLLSAFSSQAQPILGRVTIEDSITVSPATFNLDLQLVVKNPELVNDPASKNWVKSFKGNIENFEAHIASVFVCVRYANKPEDSAGKTEFAKLYRPSTALLVYGWEEEYWVKMTKQGHTYVTTQPIKLRQDWTYAYDFIIRANEGTEKWFNDPSNKTNDKLGNSLIEVK